MGSITRPALLLGTRSVLHNFPAPATLLETIDAKSNQLKLSEDWARGLAINGAQLELGTEVVRVMGKPSQSSAITVLRGYMGTVAQPHNAGDLVSVHSVWGWTDYELRKFLDRAVRWLKPAFWVHAISPTFLSAIDDLNLSLPAGLNLSYPDGHYPYRLEYQDTSRGPTVWLPVDGWKQEGANIRLRARPESAYTLRLQYIEFQSILTDDVTPLGDDGAEEPLIFRAAHQALLSLAANRTRYLEYAASLNDRASSPDELIRSAYALFNAAVQAKDALARPLPSGYLAMYREPRT